VFPLFGTGQGGAAVGEVLGPMFDGIVNALADDESAFTRLMDIYISAYTLPDVEAVISFMRSQPLLAE